MFDFSTIQYNTENPTFITIVFTVICSFILSSLIAFTYEKTSRNISPPTYYIQALILISIVAAMVMQAIGDSLARGLGMLGALAIIRFRTTLRNPRNIVFMFSSLAAGIACGVFGFVIAFVGTFSFCLVAFILRFTPFSKANNLIGTIGLEIADTITEQSIVDILKANTRNFILKSYKVTTGKKTSKLQYEYQVVLKEDRNRNELLMAFRDVEGVSVSKFEFRDTEESI